MVQDIEHLCAELQLDRLVNWKIAVDCKIPLSSSESSQEIPRHIPLSKRESRVGVTRWIGKRVRIESLSTGARLSKGPQAEPGDIGIRRGTAVVPEPSPGRTSATTPPKNSKKLLSEDIDRRGGTSLNEVLEGPATQNRACEAIDLRRRDVIGQPAEKALRMSKSEGPRLAFMAKEQAHWNCQRAEPAEAVSIECDHV